MENRHSDGQYSRLPALLFNVLFVDFASAASACPGADFIVAGEPPFYTSKKTLSTTASAVYDTCDFLGTAGLILNTLQSDSSFSVQTITVRNSTFNLLPAAIKQTTIAISGHPVDWFYRERFIVPATQDPLPAPKRLTFQFINNQLTNGGVIIINGTFAAGSLFNITGNNFTASSKPLSVASHLLLSARLMLSVVVGPVLLLRGSLVFVSNNIFTCNATGDRRCVPIGLHSIFFNNSIAASMSVSTVLSEVAIMRNNITCSEDGAFVSTSGERSSAIGVLLAGVDVAIPPAAEDTLQSLQAALGAPAHMAPIAVAGGSWPCVVLIEENRMTLTHRSAAATAYPNAAAMDLALFSINDTAWAKLNPVPSIIYPDSYLPSSGLLVYLSLNEMAVVVSDANIQAAFGVLLPFGMVIGFNPTAPTVQVIIQHNAVNIEGAFLHTAAVFVQFLASSFRNVNVPVVVTFGPDSNKTQIRFYDNFAQIKEMSATDIQYATMLSLAPGLNGRIVLPRNLTAAGLGLTVPEGTGDAALRTLLSIERNRFISQQSFRAAGTAMLLLGNIVAAASGGGGGGGNIVVAGAVSVVQNDFMALPYNDPGFAPAPLINFSYAAGQSPVGAAAFGSGFAPLPYGALLLCQNQQFYFASARGGNNLPIATDMLPTDGAFFNAVLAASQQYVPCMGPTTTAPTTTAAPTTTTTAAPPTTTPTTTVTTTSTTTPTSTPTSTATSASPSTTTTASTTTTTTPSTVPPTTTAAASTTTATATTAPSSTPAAATTTTEPPPSSSSSSSPVATSSAAAHTSTTTPQTTTTPPSTTQVVVGCGAVDSLWLTASQAVSATATAGPAITSPSSTTAAASPNTLQTPAACPLWTQFQLQSSSMLPADDDPAAPSATSSVSSFCGGTISIPFSVWSAPAAFSVALRLNTTTRRLTGGALAFTLPNATYDGDSGSGGGATVVAPPPPSVTLVSSKNVFVVTRTQSTANVMVLSLRYTGPSLLSAPPPVTLRLRSDADAAPATGTATPTAALSCANVPAALLAAAGQLAFGAAPPALQGVPKAAEDAVVAAGSLMSLMSLLPTTVMQMGMQSSIRSMTRCERKDMNDDDLPFLARPFPLSIGPTDGSPLRGALFIQIVILPAIFLAVVLAVIATLRAGRALITQQSPPPWREAFDFAQLPSLLLLVVAIIMDGAVSMGATLITAPLAASPSSTNSGGGEAPRSLPADRAFGIVAVGLIGAFVLQVAYFCTVGLQVRVVRLRVAAPLLCARSRSRQSSMAINNKNKASGNTDDTNGGADGPPTPTMGSRARAASIAAVQRQFGRRLSPLRQLYIRLFLRDLATAGDWLPLAPDTPATEAAAKAWLNRHGWYTEGLTVAAYRVFEVSAAFAIAFLEGIDTDDKTACVVNASVGMTILLALFVAVVVMRPFAAVFEQWMMALALGVSALGSVLLVANMVHPSPTLESAVGFTTLAATLISVLLALAVFVTTMIRLYEVGRNVWLYRHDLDRLRRKIERREARQKEARAAMRAGKVVPAAALEALMADVATAAGEPAEGAATRRGDQGDGDVDAMSRNLLGADAGGGGESSDDDDLLAALGATGTARGKGVLVLPEDGDDAFDEGMDGNDDEGDADEDVLGLPLVTIRRRRGSTVDNGSSSRNSDIDMTLLDEDDEDVPHATHDMPDDADDTGNQSPPDTPDPSCGGGAAAAPPGSSLSSNSLFEPPGANPVAVLLPRRRRLGTPNDETVHAEETVEEDPSMIPFDRYRTILDVLERDDELRRRVPAWRARQVIAQQRAARRRRGGGAHEEDISAGLDEDTELPAIIDMDLITRLEKKAAREARRK